MILFPINTNDYFCFENISFFFINLFIIKAKKNRLSIAFEMIDRKSIGNGGKGY